MPWRSTRISQIEAHNDVGGDGARLSSVDTDLVRVLAATLDVHAHDIAIIDTLDELLTPTVQSARMVVHLWATKGEFPLQVDIYLNDPNVRRRADDRDEFEVVKQVAKLSGCHVVVSDRSSDPYTWLDMHPSGAVDSIRVNAERLDEADELVVESRRSLTPARESSSRSIS